MLLFSSLLFLSVHLIVLVAGRVQTVLKPTSAAPSATAIAGAYGYTYVGCYNETTGFRSNNGARALVGGVDVGYPWYTSYTASTAYTMQTAHTSMTPSSCLKFCSKGDNGRVMQYAGLENGGECWCSPYFSLLSEKLDESSRCISPCNGNSSELCGGPNALTLYNLTVRNSQTGVAWSRFSGAAGYGTLAVITLVIGALL